MRENDGIDELYQGSSEEYESYSKSYEQYSRDYENYSKNYQAYLKNYAIYSENYALYIKQVTARSELDEDKLEAAAIKESISIDACMHNKKNESESAGKNYSADPKLIRPVQRKLTPPPPYPGYSRPPPPPLQCLKPSGPRPIPPSSGFNFSKIPDNPELPLPPQITENSPARSKEKITS